MRRELLSFDVWRNQFSKISVAKVKSPSCPSCGEDPLYPYLTWDKSAKASVLCGRDTVQIRPAEARSLDFQSLAKQLERAAQKITANPYLLSFQAGENRVVVFRDGRALIHGTKDPAEARKIYQKYLG